jgi:hypothetical protein
MTEGEKWVMARNHPSPETAFDAGVVEGKRQSQEKIDRLFTLIKHLYAGTSEHNWQYEECEKLITEIEKEK